MLRHPPEWEEEVNFRLQWCDLEHLPGMMISMLDVTPEEITGRYVSLERYVPGKDRRR